MHLTAHMSFIDMSDYNRGVRAYWWSCTTVGALVVTLSLRGLAALDSGRLAAVLALMAIAAIAGLSSTRVPSTQVFITPGDVFVFLAALLYGTPAATLVGVSDAFSTSCRRSRRWTSRIGGPALMAISVFISAKGFDAARLWLDQKGFSGTVPLLTSLLLFSLVYFLLNSLLLAGHQALKKGAPILDHWLANYLWVSLTYSASASAAGLIYLTIREYGLASLLASGPLIAVIFATFRLYFKQTDERAKTIEEISRVHLATVEALATAIDAKDEITHEHVYRVQVYTTGLARHFGLGEPEIEALKAGALLHDVGKIAVPDYILNKPGKLTAAEFEKMKIHTVVGAQIMERVNFPYPVVPIVRHHHERWDGRGYPDGLAGEQIPLTARILSVVDAFDAIREDRQYRKGMKREQACAFLAENAGKQFDPKIVAAFLQNLASYEEEIRERPSNPLVFAPSKQAGISESGARAEPGAGLAQTVNETPEYVRQIHAAHVEVAALYEMAQTFSANLDVSDVVALTSSRLERMIPFTTCVFYLRRERDDSAVAAYAFGKHSDEIRGKSLGAGRGIAGWVIINGRAMTNTDAMLDLKELLGPASKGYRTATVFPLTGGDNAIGALALYSSELDSYDGGHLHLLESVSRLASTALQRALLHEQTKASTRTDALTGLPTGPALYAQMDQEVAAAKTRGESLVALSIRLIGLRAVNESFGYQVGDRVLAESAHLVRDLVGQSGLLGRIAGDEFICVLRHCDHEEAAKLGEIIRKEVDSLVVETKPGDRAHIRINYAVEGYTAGQTVDELLHAIAVAARSSPTTQKLGPLNSETTTSQMVS
jgi:diguanylate cyclase (GGDEF)-like protein/putative nucleotidyltransferase with HDIG domain